MSFGHISSFYFLIFLENIEVFKMNMHDTIHGGNNFFPEKLWCEYVYEFAHSGKYNVFREK